MSTNQTGRHACAVIPFRPPRRPPENNSIDQKISNLLREARPKKEPSWPPDALLAGGRRCLYDIPRLSPERLETAFFYLFNLYLDLQIEEAHYE